MGMGDELMATGLAKLLHRESGKKVMIVDARGRLRKHDIFVNNPKIVQPGQSVKDYILLRNHSGSGRPYFSNQNDRKFIFKEFKPEPGELFFTNDELQFSHKHAVDVIIEPNIKNAVSVDNKDWGISRWLELAELLRTNGIKFTQLAPQYPPARLLPGAEFIATQTFRQAAAVMAKAKIVICTEGGLHHAAAALGIPAVVIYGGFISPNQTGYDLHVNLFTGGTPCGHKFSCDHCKEAMAKISPQEVFAHVIKLLKGQVKLLDPNTENQSSE